MQLQLTDTDYSPQVYYHFPAISSCLKISSVPLPLRKESVSPKEFTL